MSRVVLDQVSKQIAKPIVVENRPGAGGVLGANVVAKAAPDGHTMLASGALATTYALYPNLPYDTLRDFVPVIPVGQQPMVLVAAPSKGFRSVNDLVDIAKAKPGKLNFASTGVGSPSHFAAERLRISAQFEAQHIPFRGPTEGLTETLAGRIDFFFVTLAPALSLINDGKLIALAVSTSTRSPALAQVPTIAELGLPNATYEFWVGLFLPAKTPRDIVVRIHREGVDALQISAVRDRLAAIGIEPMPMGLEQFDRYFQSDVEAAVKLVKAAKIVAQQ
jgi:tripartite-type tricarboxylate transporter receptor subunit TctC